MTATSGASLSLADFVTGHDSLDWTEAVAVVAELCAAILARDPAALHLPDAADVSIDPSGTMTITRNPQTHDVSYAALLLQGLLGASVTPPPLRLFVTRALESNTHGSVAEFAEALAYFERPGRQALVQQAIQNTARGAHLRPTAKATPPTPATKPAGDAPARRSPKNRVAIMAGVAVGVAAVAAIVALRFVDTRTGALPPSMTQVVERAANALTAASGSIRARFGLVSDATPPGPPESASIDAPAAVSRSTQARGSTARGASPDVSTPDATSAAEAGAVQPGEPAAAPITRTSAGNETPVDDEVYSSQSADVVPPKLVDAGRLPSNALTAAPTDAVEVLVDRNGQVRQVKLLTETRRMTDVMLLSAAKAWRFSPATRNGQPVQYRLVLNWSTVTRQ